MQKNLIDYGRLVDEAMHVMVFKVLKRVEQEGLPGEHHFFISFITKYKGVKIGENLLEKYPHDMTIVLQHQYQDLKVDAKGFAITLSFSGNQESIYVPYSSIVSFADPSVQFGLQFREVEYEFDDMELEDNVSESVPHSSVVHHTKKGKDHAGNVISFDSLRKHRNN